MPYNVTIDDISPLITYTGTWKDFCDRPPNKDLASSLYFGTTFHSSGTPGSTATIKFNGTAIYIYGAKRSNYGYYTVSVDNGTPQRFDAYVETPTGVGALARQLLFSQNGLEDTLHEVVFANTEENSGRATVDIDYVTWTSGLDSQIATTTLDDTHQNWTYTGPWELRPGNDIFNGTTHLVSASGAQASLTFEGIGIYLYGHLWKDHGGFNITIDDAPPITLNGFASAWFAQVPLYYADGLGPGTHTLTATNIEGGKVLSLDYVRVLKSQPFITSPPQSTTDGASPTNYTGIIAGVAGGLAALIILAICIGWYWFRIRRRGRYELVNAQDQRNGGFMPPPMGYAPRSAGPGWVNGASQPQHVSRAYTHRERAALRPQQPAPNSRSMTKMRAQQSQVNTSRAAAGRGHS